MSVCMCRVTQSSAEIHMRFVEEFLRNFIASIKPSKIWLYLLVFFVFYYFQFHRKQSYLYLFNGEILFPILRL